MLTLLKTVFYYKLDSAGNFIMEMLEDRYKLPLILTVVIILVLYPVVYSQDFSEEMWKKLDTFEASRLSKAEQLYSKKQYKEALTAYQAFINEFPKSIAIPYALLRKGLCLENDNKRYAAVEVYQEILDFFPDKVEFAAPAIYFIGRCHWQNGDLTKAMKVWLDMVTDKEYRKHDLASDALNKLADNMAKMGELDKAVKYYMQVAVDFRDRTPEAVMYAINKVYSYYILYKNEEALRNFYRAVQGFETRKRYIPDGLDLTVDKDYWKTVWTGIWREQNNITDSREKSRFFSYWAEVLERYSSKNSDWDEYLVQTAFLHYNVDKNKNRENWYRTMDEIFARKFKEGDFDRVLTWIGYYHDHKSKILEYVGKLNLKKINIDQVKRLIDVLVKDNLHVQVFREVYSNYDLDHMKNEEIVNIAILIYEKIGEIEWGRSVISKLKLAEMPDDEKVKVIGSIEKYDGISVRNICYSFMDKDKGKFTLLKYYYKNRKEIPGMDMPSVQKERMELADYLTGVEAYAKTAWWIKGCFLQWEKKYADAIMAYRNADNPPDNIWAIVECYISMREYDNAINELIQLENFFPNQAPKAALTMAYVYRQAKRTKEEISAFRRVLKKYPKSSESRTAHIELEKMGIPIGGGVDAE